MTESPGTLEPERARDARGRALVAPLDDEQRTAVLAQGGPVLISGAPGTGKTRVLVHRMAFLCTAAQIPPRRVLFLTSSESAAEDVRTRVARLVGAPLHGAWVSTFPSVCLKILRAHAAAVGRRASFVVFGEARARRVIRRALLEVGAERDGGVDADVWPATRVAQEISAAKHRLTVPTGVLGELYRAYERALAEENAFDQDDVIMYVLRLLGESSALRDKYRRRFAHVLVDDFQDRTRPQLELLRLLAATDTGAGGHIAVAGDEDEWISPRREPGTDNPALFRASFPQAQTIVLRRGYRSSGRIMHVAARLIAHNHGGVMPTVAPERRRGRRVVIAAFGDELEEAAAVARWVELLARHGDVLLSRTAILYRHELQARPFEEALQRAGLPYRVIGGLRFWERREIQDMMCYLRLAVGGGDPGALARVANVPRRGIGPASVRTIARLQRGAPINVAEAALRAAQLPRVTAARAGALADLGRLLGDLDRAAQQRPIAELIDYVTLRTGYSGMLAELPAADEETRRAGIDELRALARSFPGPATAALPRLFDHAAQAGALPWAAGLAGRRDDDDDDEGDEGEDSRRPVVSGAAGGVQLLTYQNARGHEFDAAFLTGVEEGLLPAGSAKAAAERRLLYVGATRARRRLVLTYALSRTLLGRPAGGAPSRFLAELGRRTRRFRLGSARLRPVSLVSTEASPTTTTTPEPAALAIVREGQRVRHVVYGVGVVQHVDGEGTRATVVVEFPDVGAKRLSVGLARLLPA